MRKSTITRYKSAFATAICAFFMSQTTHAAPQTITPGALWRDTQGEIIQAHGGGILKVGETYYWFGENRAPAPAGGLAAGVKCYSSTDLAHWTFRTDALMRQATGDLAPNRVIERPKVLYNAPTKTFVMYFHLDSPNYGDAKVGVATCAKVDGVYTYRSGFRPLNHQSRDMTLFQDDDGAGYLIFEDRERGFVIARLSADYLSVEREVALIRHGIEASALIHVGDTYYLLGSYMSGWNANPNVFMTAPNLAGPWTEPQGVAPRETNTFDSQTAFILPVHGSKTTNYIYMGDRWQGGQNLRLARYIWLPLTLKDKTLRLESNESWTLDAQSGEIALQPLPKIAEGDYYLTNRATGLRLSVTGVSSDDGAAIIGAPTAAGDSQIWHIAPANYGYYSIVNKRSGKRLDVGDKSMQSGSAIVQWTATGGDNQLWRIAPAANGALTITAKHSDQPLALADAANPTITQQAEATGAAQEWQLLPVAR